MSPELFLSVQYGVPAPELPRWRLRRWVRRAIDAIAIQQQTQDDLPDAVITGFTAVALTLRLVDADEGQALNRQFRERDYPTNVLTFEYGMDPAGTVTGDLVLCLPVLHREAGEQGKTLLDHAAHLTVHGVLHALGYDHIDPEDARTMETMEISILQQMTIANPYQ